MSDTVLPVIIIGGGPVGLALAEELAYHRIPVTVIEPRTTVDHSRPRAKTTSVRTMEHFRRWGIADRLRAAAPLSPDWSQRVTFAQSVTAREIAHVDDCLGLNAADSLSPECAQQVTQPIVEEVLRDDLSARPEADLLLGWTAVSIADRDDRVQVTIEDGIGAQRILTARWVVGADGPRSIVRATMGAVCEGSAGGRANVNITFRSSELDDLIPHPPSIHFWVLDPEAPGVIGPLDKAGTWWAIATGTPRIDDDDHAARLVRRLVGADIDVEVIATDPWQARMLLADSYRAGRLFIVGDAAHQNPPWGGHGFNTGVGDAVNLGWKLAAVLSGWAPAELLDSYEPERRPVEEATIALAAANMASLSTDLGDPRLMADGPAFEAARAELGPVIQALKSPEFHSTGLVLGYGYGPDSAAQAPTPADYLPHPALGNRLPHRRLGDASIFDLLGEWFTLIGAAASAAPALAAGAELGIPITHLETADTTALLVRPDQHIAAVGDANADWTLALADAVRGFHITDEAPQ